MLKFSNRLSHFSTNWVQRTTTQGQAQAAWGQATLGAHQTRPPVESDTNALHQGKEKPRNSLGTHGKEGAELGPGGPGGRQGNSGPLPCLRVWLSFPVLRTKTADGNPEELKTSLQKRARPGQSGRPRLESFTNRDLRQSLKRWASSFSPVKWVWAASLPNYRSSCRKRDRVHGKSNVNLSYRYTHTRGMYHPLYLFKTNPRLYSFHSAASHCLKDDPCAPASPALGTHQAP